MFPVERLPDEDKQKQQTMRLPADEFIRRFLMHAVPPGFPRIRYYAFLASANRKMALPLCRKLLAVPVLDLLPSGSGLQGLV